MKSLPAFADELFLIAAGSPNLWTSLIRRAPGTTDFIKKKNKNKAISVLTLSYFTCLLLKGAF